jgi:hypothetical protein
MQLRPISTRAVLRRRTVANGFRCRFVASGIASASNPIKHSNQSITPLKEGAGLFPPARLLLPGAGGIPPPVVLPIFEVLNPRPLHELSVHRRPKLSALLPVVRHAIRWRSSGQDDLFLARPRQRTHFCHGPNPFWY